MNNGTMEALMGTFTVIKKNNLHALVATLHTGGVKVVFGANPGLKCDSVLVA